MITENQKKEIFNSLQFYYSNTKFSINGLQNKVFSKNYNSQIEFEKVLYNENTRIFFRDLITPRGKIIDGISTRIIKNIPEIIKTEFYLFSRNKSKTEKENWLNHTYNFIVNINDLSRFINKSDVVPFLDWYDSMIKNKSNEKQIIELKDFFKNTTPLQLESINESFSKFKGKNLAIVIYFLIQKNRLNIIKSSEDFGLSSFLKLFAGLNNIEAVRKSFDASSSLNFDLKDKNNLPETGIENKIDSIYKVG